MQKPVGRDVSRRLTDWAGFFLYAIAGTLFVVLLVHAFHFGNPDRIVYGTDYQGHVCGKGAAPVGLTPAQWTAKQLLWYPITFNMATLSFEVANALRFGVCVESCPLFGSLVPTYGGGGSMVPSSFTAFFTSDVALHRCLPVFASYSCPASNAQCERAKGSQQASFLAQLGVGDLFYGAVTQVHHMWGMVVTLCLVAILMCYGWLFSLRRLVKPLMVFTAVGFFVCLVAVGIVAAKQRTTVAAGSSSEDWYTAVAVLSLLSAAVYLCALLYFYKDLLLSCDIIELSSRVIVDIPSVAVVPVVSAVLVFLAGLFAFFIAVMIYSSSTLETQQQLVPQQSNASATYVATLVPIPEKWRTIGQLYNIFMFLWTMGFLHAVSYITVAFVAVQWYWSTPGAEKPALPPSPVLWGVTTAVRYHLGTLLVGSFLIAVVQLARILLRLLERHLRKIGGEQRAIKCLMCIAECLLACFERLVKFLTKNAYIMTALTGDSLIDGAQHATSLLLRNANVLFVDMIGEVIMTVGKALITAFVVLLGYAWMEGLNSGSSDNAEATGAQQAQRNFVVVLAFLALVVYFVASVFASVFSVCIDSVLLCYCLDKSENNGQDRPHFYPPELETHLATATARSGRKADASSGVSGGGNESKPLLPGGSPM